MTVNKKYSPRCFLDIEIDGEKAGRVVVELFVDVCPKTCENFRALCTGELGIGKTTQVPLHYKGVPFHRIVKGFVIQAGDFVAGDGKGGESIYGGQFPDENFDIPHDKPFLLSMSNRGKDTNGSQFFITTQLAPHLNGKHTVFGQVVVGHEVVTKIESLKTDNNCRPIKDVVISNCGELVLRIKAKKEKEVDPEEEISDSGEKEKKHKKKHKHKHKKERREAKEIVPDIPAANDDEDDYGMKLDPEEIPSVPTNNFLMRRTSPFGDGNNIRRRPSPQRREGRYQRPSRSRSGRKIKGRGFMRYRTPSRSTSRSGSETPPHWKQAQSRLTNIKDIVLPPAAKQMMHSEGSAAEDDPFERNQNRTFPDQGPNDFRDKRRDARHNLQENRKTRDWDTRDFPTKHNEGGPIRSTIVMATGFNRNIKREFSPSQDKRNNNNNDRRENKWRQNDNENGTNNKNRREIHRRFSFEKGARHGRTDNRARSSSEDEDEAVSKPPRTAVNPRAVASLACELTRYRKDFDQDEEQEDKKKGEDRKSRRHENKKPSPVRVKPPRKSSPKVDRKTVKSLLGDLGRYRKDFDPEEEEEEKRRKEEKKKVEEPKVKKIEEQSRQAAVPIPSKKSAKALVKELMRYHKGLESSEEEEEKRPLVEKKAEVPPKVPSPDPVEKKNVKVLIPGINDDEDESMDTDDLAPPGTVPIVMKEPPNITVKLEPEDKPKPPVVEEKIPFLSNSPPKKSSPPKTGRWDIGQEYLPPDDIPLPDEDIPLVGEEDVTQKPVPQQIESLVPPTTTQRAQSAWIPVGQPRTPSPPKQSPIAHSILLPQPIATITGGRAPIKNSKSPLETKRVSRSPRTSKSLSPPRKTSRSVSPRKISRSPSPPRRKLSRSRSPKRKLSKSRSPTGRKLSRSRSPRRKLSRSPSPKRKLSRSRSPAGRKSRSPRRKLSRSRSPAGRKLSRSRSPRRKLSRSRSPRRKLSRSLSPRRKLSPARKLSRSRSPRRKLSPARKLSRSRSPRRKLSRSASPRRKLSPARKLSRSRSPRRKLSRSPGSPRRKSSRSPKRRSVSPRSKRRSSSSPEGRSKRPRLPLPRRARRSMSRDRLRRRSRSRSPVRGSRIRRGGARSPPRRSPPRRAPPYRGGAPRRSRRSSSSRSRSSSSPSPRRSKRRRSSSSSSGSSSN